jgi:tight adherence protein C
VILLAILGAGAVLLIVLGLAGNLGADRVQTRLYQLTPGQARNLEELELQQPFLERTLRPVIGLLSGWFRSAKNVASVARATQRLDLAGNPGNFTGEEWLGTKVMLALGSGIGAVLLSTVVGMPLALRFILAVTAVGGGYSFPEFWLGARISARQHKIVRMLPDSLDLLTVSVRAGLGFDASLAKVIEKVPGPLSEEFRRALAEVRLGRNRREALRDIVTRTDVGPLSTFLGAIIQAEQLGVAISRVLEVQSEQLRIERRQRAEEMAAKAPIKMLFPLVGCIFPSIFIVILGPALLSILNTLGSM